MKKPAKIPAFRPGVYQHYKGAHYLALALGRDDETDEAVVIYVRLYARQGLPVSVRRLKVWNEKVSVRRGARTLKVPRFRYVGNAEPA